MLKLKLKIILIGIIFSFFPLAAQATIIDFNIDPSYDYLGREKVTAFLHQLGEKVYFYVEDDYYKTLDIEKRKEFTEALKRLSQEFDGSIYPQLTKIFGSEWKPGIDRDEKITVLITKIKEDAGGYFNSGDEYPVLQSPDSNEKEMIYLNADYITNHLAKSFLAHEFMHLIIFNQKDKLRGISEETWLNEARADYAPTLLGYDAVYLGSNLQRRVDKFLKSPQDSLTEWKNLSPDYGVANLFIQYLVDHYGVKILTDSLQSEKVGIPSLNEALQKSGFTEDFSQIFTDWTIALLINDCGVEKKYCYLNPSLKTLKIAPQINYLPLAGESILSVTDYTKNWAGNWFKFIGGKGILKLEFVGDQKVKFKVPYLLQDMSGAYSVNFLLLDNSHRGTFYIADFGKKYSSLIIIPSIQEKMLGFDGLEPFYQFIWSSSITNDTAGAAEEELIQQLLARIDYLKNEIAKIQAQISAKNKVGISCQGLGVNLYYGIKNSGDVRCLQEFLKVQGPEIYPEGIVTGNFLPLTLSAVARFQEKYASEILTPLGLQKGTGYVGFSTRAKINQLLTPLR